MYKRTYLVSWLLFLASKLSDIASRLLYRILIKRYADAPTGIYNAVVLSLPFWILIIWFSCSCTAQEPIITERRGIVVDVIDARTVEVMYNVLNRPHSTKALNIYYWPDGHNLKAGDPYPPCISFYHTKSN